MEYYSLHSQEGIQWQTIVPGAFPVPRQILRTLGLHHGRTNFMVVLGPVIKIMFMEQGGPTEPIFFRSAVTMSHQDAIALKNLLTRMLTDVERQIQEAVAKAGNPPNV